MLIAHSYLDSIREIQHLNIEYSDIKDVFIYGSIANYFYTKKSDIDMCIVIDFDSVAAKNPEATATPQNFKLFYYNWAMTHRCKIYERKIDVSVEDIKRSLSTGRYRSGPCFSVMKKEWIFKPIIISDTEFKTMRTQAGQVYKKIIHDFHHIKRNGFEMADCKKLYSDIYSCKNTSHLAHLDQPVTYMYLAFREIRDRGMITKLRDRMIELESKHFVLK